MTAPLVPTGAQPRWASEATDFLRLGRSRQAGVRLGQGMMGDDLQDFLAKLDSDGGDDARIKDVIQQTMKSPEVEQMYLQREQEVARQIEELSVRTKDVMRSGRVRALAARSKNGANRTLGQIGKGYHEEFPMESILRACSDNNVMVVIDSPAELAKRVVRESAECGSEHAKEQHANFGLAAPDETRTLIPAREGLVISWCVMPSRRYEIVAYIS